jgi:hypothetical protein
MTDIHFEESTCPSEEGEGKTRDCYKIVIILDGWNHMEPIDEDELTNFFTDVRK